MFKKAVRRGRSERRVEAYSLRYVEALSDARTKLADFFNTLLQPAQRRDQPPGQDEEGDDQRDHYKIHVMKLRQLVISDGYPTKSGIKTASICEALRNHFAWTSECTGGPTLR
jgi:hypothetical protein